MVRKVSRKYIRSKSLRKRGRSKSLKKRARSKSLRKRKQKQKKSMKGGWCGRRDHECKRKVKKEFIKDLKDSSETKYTDEEIDEKIAKKINQIKPYRSKIRGKCDKNTSEMNVWVKAEKLLNGGDIKELCPKDIKQSKFKPKKENEDNGIIYTDDGRDND